MRIIMLLVVVVLMASPVCGWDGYDYDKGSYVEVEKGNLVRYGSEIDVYDYDDGSYHNVEVQSVDSDTLEVYDYDTGEYRTFDMD